jgi:hypothetical protein
LGLPKFVHLWIFDKAKWAICQANRLRTVRIGVWLPCFCDKKQTISCLSIRSSPRPTHISRYIGKKMSNTHTHLLPGYMNVAAWFILSCCMLLLFVMALDCWANTHPNSSMTHKGFPYQVPDCSNSLGLVSHFNYVVKLYLKSH